MFHFRTELVKIALHNCVTMPEPAVTWLPTGEMLRSCTAPLVTVFSLQGDQRAAGRHSGLAAPGLGSGRPGSLDVLAAVCQGSIGRKEGSHAGMVKTPYWSNTMAPEHLDRVILNMVSAVRAASLA